MIAGTLLLASGAAVFAVRAQEHPPMPGGRGPGPGGAMMMFDGPPGHFAGRLDRQLDGLGVSDAQRSQIRQIGMAAAADLRTQRDSSRRLHEQAARIFTAPTVDAAAAETLRQQMLVQQEQSSRRVLQAMLDVAQVLTPAQRARLGERMRDHQAMMDDRSRRMERHMPGVPGVPGPLGTPAPRQSP